MHRRRKPIARIQLVGLHAGLKSLEKYDKTGDKFIPCNACGTLCDISDEICFRCKCPLLK